MRSSPWLIVVGAASTCACADRGPARPSRVETTAVRCVEEVDTGQRLPDGKPDVFTLQGPGACAPALTAFLLQHPALRIGEIVPIQYVREAQPYLEPGTQELVVVHADDGPWPRARDLRVDGPASPCVDPDHSTGTRDMRAYSARYCDKSIARDYALLDYVFVVPLVSERQQRLETWDYVEVVRRKD